MRPKKKDKMPVDWLTDENQKCEQTGTKTDYDSGARATRSENRETNES